MHKVHLEEFMYPCAHYALQRTGMPGSISELLSTFGSEYNEATVRPGDIVMWENEPTHEEVATTILDSGLVITSQATKDRHYGVYEGGGYVSDLAFDKHSDIPKIRVRELSELREPSRVITRIHE